MWGRVCWAARRRTRRRPRRSDRPAGGGRRRAQVSRLNTTSSTPSRMSSTTRSPRLAAASGRSIWVTSPVTTIFEPKPEAGQEHLHLLRRGVLGLVEDDERVVQRAPAHVGQWRDLDGAGREQLGDRLRVEHVVQSVVERSQVGVDLLAQRAGQEAEPLAGLDRGPGQDDPVDRLGLQRLHGLGHRQVGLAGAGRADAERDRVLVDRVDVALLVQRLGTDRAAAVGQDVEAQHVGRTLGRLGAQHRQHSLDRLGVTPWPVRMIATSSSSRRSASAISAGWALQGDPVPAHMDVGVEGLLDQREVLVAGPEQADHVDAVGHHDGVLGPGNVGVHGGGCQSWMPGRADLSKRSGALPCYGSIAHGGPPSCACAVP